MSIIEEPWSTEELQYCACKDNEDGDTHECPYAADVNNEPNSECNCCPECTQQCADDI